MVQLELWSRLKLCRGSKLWSGLKLRTVKQLSRKRLLPLLLDLQKPKRNPQELDGGLLNHRLWCMTLLWILQLTQRNLPQLDRGDWGHRLSSRKWLSTLLS
jgi:hypothetical protein